jgi:DNA-binding response OmpR family regulator
MENKKILLIVEDDRPILELILDKLNNEGFKTLAARDGEEGLKAAEENHPDLILLDIILPKMSGIIMLEKLRTTEWGKTVPVILLTNLSSDDEEIIASINKYKPADYLIKTDWSIGDVVKKIKEKLK